VEEATTRYSIQSRLRAAFHVLVLTIKKKANCAEHNGEGSPCPDILILSNTSITSRVEPSQTFPEETTNAVSFRASPGKCMTSRDGICRDSFIRVYRLHD
jgi:hypothetical protein